MNQYGRKQEKIYLVIPAYEPDGRWVDLLSQAEKTGKFRMIVVNDGSSRKYDMFFEEAEFYATVLNHLQNQGKGSALKTALQYIQATDGKGYVVTADADGQHALPDILSVAEYCQNHPEALVLGWAKRDAPIREIPIETIYLDNNSSSHFRPVQDAVLIYKDLFKFGGGSSTMYFNGQVINQPTTNGKSFKERAVSDIVYIGY